MRKSFLCFIIIALCSFSSSFDIIRCVQRSVCCFLDGVKNRVVKKTREKPRLDLCVSWQKQRVFWAKTSSLVLIMWSKWRGTINDDVQVVVEQLDYRYFAPHSTYLAFSFCLLITIKLQTLQHFRKINFDAAHSIRTFPANFKCIQMMMPN
jgi:hypothetical protein